MIHPPINSLLQKGLWAYDIITLSACRKHQQPGAVRLLGNRERDKIRILHRYTRTIMIANLHNNMIEIEIDVRWQYEQQGARQI